MATIPLAPDFKEFLRLLNARHVKYLLVGGYAVSFHGYARSTADMDIWVRPDPDNAARLLDALHEFGFAISDAEALAKPDHMLGMGLKPLRIKVLTSISGVEFDDCYANRVEAVIGDLTFAVIDLFHLRVNKAASGRHKDLDDLENLPTG